MKRPREQPQEPAADLVSVELIEACRRGDENAWRDVVESTHREVYTLCLRILKDPDDAAEATQDAYLKAWRGLGGFRGEARFSTWLYRVATNAALSKLRSKKRRTGREVQAEDEWLADMASPTSTEAAAGTRLDLRRLEQAIQQLPDQLRIAVLLRDVYGLSTEEAAKQMKCSVTAAKVRVHRARKRLKEMALQEGEEGFTA